MNYKYDIHLTQFEALKVHFCPTIKHIAHENPQIINKISKVGPQIRTKTTTKHMN